MSTSAETFPARRAGTLLGLDAGAWLMIIGVMLAVVLEILDTSIVNVALSSMMGNLGATVDEISWVATSYIVANVIVIPMTSFFAARFGRRRYFVGSILLFTLASFLCGAARTLPELVAFRVLQGLGGGALLAVAQSVMIETFPPQQQGTGQAIFGVGAMLGPSLGPTLGGYITDRWSWPWIFYVNVPLGIAAALLCWRYLPAQRSAARSTARVDWTGIGLLVLGMASLQIMLETGHRNDWFESSWIATLAGVAVLATAWFVWHELHTQNPVVDLRVFRHRSLVLGCLYGVAMGIGLYGSLFLFPLFTQRVLHWTSWQAGMAVLPSSLATALCMPLAGRYVWKVGPAPLFATGVAFFLPSLWGMSQWTAQSDWWDLFWPQIGRGIAMGMMFSPLSVATLRALPPQDVLQGSGLYNLFRQTGGSLGIALLATLIDQRGAVHHAYLAESVTPFAEMTRQRLAALSAGLQAHGMDPVAALQGAYELIEKTLLSQAEVLAFRDGYLLVLLTFVLLVPLIPLLRRPEMAASRAEADAHL